MFGPRGTGQLYLLAMQRLFGLIQPDDLVPVVDLFSRPELWSLHQGSLWTTGATAGIAAGGAGFRSFLAVFVPAATTRTISIVERLRLSGIGATETLNILAGPVNTTGAANVVHRDVRRATAAGALSAGIGTRQSAQNGVALPGSLANIDQVRVPANNTIDVQLDFVLEPGSMILCAALADNTAIASAMTFYGRERPATEEEIQI